MARARWWLEFAAIRGFVGLLGLLPLRALPVAAARLGDLMMLLLRRRVAIGRENLRRGLGGEPAALDRILRRSFRHFAQVPLELVFLDRILARRPAAEVLRMERQEVLQDLHRRGQGAVLLTGHLGNWEVLGAILPLLGLPLTTVGRALDNPLLDRWVNRARTRHGLAVVEKDGATRPLARTLRDGGLVAMLLDQHAGRHGVRVPFLGRPASTFQSGARLARRFGVPLVPAVTWRERDLLVIGGRVGPVIWPDPDLDEEEDVYRMTVAYSRFLEQGIREHPEQWLWFHRRWRDGGAEPEPAWVARYAGAS